MKTRLEINDDVAKAYYKDVRKAVKEGKNELMPPENSILGAHNTAALGERKQEIDGVMAAYKELIKKEDKE